MSLRPSLLAVACILAVPFAASAQPAQQVPPSPGGTPAAGKYDPNEVVCEKQEETGSRLAVKRVCMPRYQWAERKSQDRQEIERVQMQRGALAPH